MFLRDAKPIDIHDMGEVQGACNLTDTLSRYFVKDMEKYHTSYIKGNTRFCKRRVAEPGAVAFVIETEPADYTTDQSHRAPEVVAFAVWKRIGTSETAKQWKTKRSGWFDSFNRSLDAVEDKYLQIFTGVNCNFKGARFAEVLPMLSTPFDAEVFSEAWELDLFFTHPKWQRKGFGRKLLQWGFDQATKENVPVVVKSSSLGAAAYKACGFRTLGELDLKKVYDTTELGGEEPQMLVWEPESSKDVWYERGKEALEKLLSEKAGDKKET